MVTLVLPLTYLPLSSNDQRRAHWTTVRDAKQLVELVVREAVKKAKLSKIDGPVDVRLMWYAKEDRVRDVDSLGPMLKACLDALTTKRYKGKVISEGILEDDNSSIVREVHLGPIELDKQNPRFELHIRRLG